MKKTGIRAMYYDWLNWRISAKVISSIVCVTFLSAISLMAVNSFNNMAQLSAQVGDELVSLGNQTLLRVSDQVNTGVQVLETLAMTPSLAAAVKEANENRAGWTDAQITSLDEAWKADSPGIETTVTEISNNDLSNYLIDFIQNNSAEVEVFVTDQKGLNIAMTGRTSDFLQSDEGWWKAAFAGGNGAVYIGEVEYDESSKTYAMNLGVPVRDPQTQKVIGVLRGTLDISVLLQTLAGQKDNSIKSMALIDRNGVVLYSPNPAQNMQPAPENILALFEAGATGWQKTNDMDGDPAIVAYYTLAGSLGDTLGWRMITAHKMNEIYTNQLWGAGIGFSTLVFVVGIGSFITAMIINSSIAMPLGIVTKMARSLSTGDLVRELSDAEKDRVRLRKDELGEIGKAFDGLINYMQSMGLAAAAIAGNNLSASVTPKSIKDELGNAFAKMINGLRETVGLVAESASAVSSASAKLAAASEQSGQATSQIATTIQQVALGTAQQTSSVTKISGTVEQMGRTIDGVAKGAQEQARAISQASEVASRINNAIEQVTNNVQAVTRDSAQSATYSRGGAKSVKETISGMEAIRNKVGLTAVKVEEMGSRSEKIGDIVETIDDIAAQTNLLALNAAIEAARANGAGARVSEHLIQQHLLSVAGLLAELCLRSSQPLQAADLMALARRAHVDTLNITDADGVVSLSNDPTSVGFRFPEDPKQQASVFRPLLKEKDGAIAQPAQARSQDGKLYIYVGVSRRDQAGVVQAGMPAEAIENSGNYTRGFAVVADEVRKLAERSSLATKEIAALIKGIQKTVSEAITAMKASAEEVEAGVSRANSAGLVLDNILEAAESVYKQAEDAGQAASKVRAAAAELVEAVDAVSAVIEENTAATEEMAANSSELTQAIENIASVSEENSASVEEVSASTEEMSAQVEGVSTSASSLMDMAHKLQEVVSRFKLISDTNSG
jgi:methyl-accepting chemotaxis protein